MLKIVCKNKKYYCITCNLYNYTYIYILCLKKESDNTILCMNRFFLTSKGSKVIKGHMLY